jgi:predicted metal-dependent HD superfamily phosphohydrolase
MVGFRDLDRQDMPETNRCLVEAELRARAAYAEPHRHYHDERHLDSCLQLLDGVAGLSEHEQRVLRWAILWHDAVYDPSRADNEEKSAELAERELRACGVDQFEASEVAWLIMLTKGHKVPDDARLGALLVSIDLAILGDEPAAYSDHASAVRREYAHVPDDGWRQGRAAVLKRLLDADPLYPDPAFRDRLEEQARRNMTDELRALGEG